MEKTFDAESVDTPTRPRFDQLLGGVSLGGTLRLCGLFLLLGMAGNWLGNVHTAVPGVNGAGAVIGLGGYLLCLACGYVSVKVWQIRHSRPY